MTNNEVLDTLIAYFTRYSGIYRGSYLPSRTMQVVAEPGSKILRESVAEHVGLLPIAAVYLHPYLEHTVDLGKTLIMLAIHDIGELETGDMLTVRIAKTVDDREAERKAALNLLDPSLIPVFLEFEDALSYEARFAQSIDKITPHIYELIVERDVAAERHVHFGFDIQDAIEKDRRLMDWDDFLREFYHQLSIRVKNRFYN